MARQQDQQRHQKEHLTCQRHENSLFRFADILEEVARHDLETDDREDHQNGAQPLAGHLDQLGGVGVVRPYEKHGHLAREELSHEESGGRGANGAEDGHAQRLQYACILFGPVVIAHDGLHALIQSGYDHHEEQDDTVHDAVGADIEVAAVLLKRLVDEDDHDRGADMQQEGGQSDGDDAADDLAPQAENTPLEVQETLPVREVVQRDGEGRHLGDDGRAGGAADPPAEPEDEERVEDAVHRNGRQHDEHSFLRVSGCTEYLVKSQIHMGDDRAGQDDLHEVAGIVDRLLARPEEVEDGVEEEQADGHEQSTDQHVQQHDVSQRILGGAPVSLAQPDGDDGGGADADHRAESRGDVHQRQGDGQSRDGQRPDAMTDEDAVDDVVERRRGRGDDGGDGISQEQVCEPVRAQREWCYG